MKQTGKLRLPDVTLAAMTSVNLYETVRALLASMRGIEFGDVVLITHRRPFLLPAGIRYSHTSRLACIDDFNYKAVYELGEHIHTPYLILVHADGFIVHPDRWRDEFLQYDYIGAPWPLPDETDPVSYRDRDGNICRVGNSVSLRSKRLLDLPGRLGLAWEPTDNGDYNEDVWICCKMRHVFEEAGLRFAPLEVAKYFSHEHMVPEVAGIEPFAFHKWRGQNASYPRFISPVKRLRRLFLRLALPLRKAISAGESQDGI